MSEQLKLCPFCGGRAVCWQAQGDFYYHVECRDCDVKTDAYLDESDAIRVWNRLEQPLESASADVPFSSSRCDEVSK
jgi:Lar family restriction alleviation protein